MLRSCNILKSLKYFTLPVNGAFTKNIKKYASDRALKSNADEGAVVEDIRLACFHNS